MPGKSRQDTNTGICRRLSRLVARLTEEARRQGISVDAYIERLVNERAAGADLIALQASPYRELEIEPERAHLTVFEQGLACSGVRKTQL